MRQWFWFISLLTWLAATGASHAGTVVATLDGCDPWDYVQVTLDGGSTWAEGWGGRYSWTRTGGTDSLPPGPQFKTFCVEVEQNVTWQQSHEFTVVPLEDTHPWDDARTMDATAAYDIRRLWGKHYDQLSTGVDMNAFQFALWEIIYDSDRLLNSGDFQIKYPAPSAGVLAQNWLDDLSYDAPLPELRGLTSPTFQDQVFPLAVPLPPSLWCGLAMGAMLVGRRFALGRQAA